MKLRRANSDKIGASVMADASEVTVSAELTDGYRFLVDFHMEGVPALLMDEPAPLGTDAGPNAARLLAAAIANCLSASALFCLRKAHVEVRGMRTSATASMVRDERGRLRVGSVNVQIQPEVVSGDAGRIGRCLELFEDYCVVTQSVRAGLPVSVEVAPVQPVPAVDV
ncbi:MAG: OsmC family protein [Micromonosporaceae bacterium]